MSTEILGTRNDTGMLRCFLPRANSPFRIAVDAISVFPSAFHYRAELCKRITSWASRVAEMSGLINAITFDQ